MPSASSCSAARTTSSTERLWPRWMTSAPWAWISRRMMLMAASWPSNRLAAVTKRSGGRASALALAERSWLAGVLMLNSTAWNGCPDCSVRAPGPAPRPRRTGPGHGRRAGAGGDRPRRARPRLRDAAALVLRAGQRAQFFLQPRQQRTHARQALSPGARAGEQVGQAAQARGLVACLDAHEPVVGVASARVHRGRGWQVAVDHQPQALGEFDVAGGPGRRGAEHLLLPGGEAG